MRAVGGRPHVAAVVGEAGARGWTVRPSTLHAPSHGPMPPSSRPHREQEEHLGELALAEVVGQELHAVGAQHRRVLVLAGVLVAQASCGEGGGGQGRGQGDGLVQAKCQAAGVAACVQGATRHTHAGQADHKGWNHAGAPKGCVAGRRTHLCALSHTPPPCPAAPCPPSACRGTAAPACGTSQAKAGMRGDGQGMRQPPALVKPREHVVPEWVPGMHAAV